MLDPYKYRACSKLPLGTVTLILVIVWRTGQALPFSSQNVSITEIPSTSNGFVIKLS